MKNFKPKDAAVKSYKHDSSIFYIRNMPCGTVTHNCNL